MDKLFNIDWQSVFIPSSSILEMLLRGTLTYFVLFIFLRIFRRQSGAIGITDLLVVVVIADAAQNAMAGEYKSITEGVALVATIAFWDFTLDWLGYKISWFERLLRPKPLMLIKDGQVIRKNLREEMITMEELKSLLREQGAEKISEVKKCYLEGNGHLSVIKFDKNSDDATPERKNIAG